MCCLLRGSEVKCACDGDEMRNATDLTRAAATARLYRRSYTNVRPPPLPSIVVRDIHSLYSTDSLVFSSLLNIGLVKELNRGLQL